ncbi:S8 family serine peptidase [Nocardioides albus]|uniref:Subtilisin family serine protease/N-acetylneuraminic acid mutarotase n=1 Tax=Nocardioides albus TaxID=1841 RepID=A0A7W5A7H2_9ACTN|nr:S8 family serine peptidase [Nocardioides albus]MBB3091108.1 subtilisin family serine protease/N-acetylneuraminic acid mutarotase [Nocardioides albus]GGU34288.1 hypothetical protein GCM10007979_36770 [Nocardioides albus]
MSHLPHRRSGRHRHSATLLAGALAAAVAVGMTGTAAVAAAPAPTAAKSVPASSPTTPKASTEIAPEKKVKPDLRHQLEDRDTADFWVDFDDRADLSSAAAIDDWDERGAAVAEALKSTADRSQRGVRARLKAAGVEFESFWATNAIKVNDGTSALAHSIAADTSVNALWPSFAVVPPKTTTSQQARATAATVEWGVANVKADQVWTQEQRKGEGVVIANIDSGVQYDHPALVKQYRGNNGDGTFTHDYSWFDAQGVCDGAPCDNDGHGTHTMGTMVGDDGAGNQIGVAPGARWIAANGCCASDTTLVSSGQWMLQPTDLSGQKPDASKRPQVINNSWGTNAPSNSPFMADISAAWTASGIFASWSNGNLGPQCATSGSPGSLAINYSVGAYDALNKIASFSSRGAGANGLVKPNISAPGVNVRSSLPGDTYGSYNGTSMAAPHVAGAVALLWSARPTLVGDTGYTGELLDGSAVDTSDLQCGGTAEDNNVYGEGRLDALALIEQVPAGPAGTATGTATDAATDEPLSGVDVRFDGPIERTVTTQADGAVDVDLPVGSYAVTATAFGYETLDLGTVQVTEDAGTELDLSLTALPSATVSGTVTDGSGHGWPLYARVRANGTPVSTYTDPATGRYSVRLPIGETYDLSISANYPGYAPGQRQVTLTDGNASGDVSLRVESCTKAPGYAADCSPIPGGLVVGAVTDAVTDKPVIDADVTRVAAPAESGRSVRTPEDDALDDGFYWLFSSATGPVELRATKGGEYTPGSQQATIAGDDVTEVDFTLGAGRLEVTPGEVTGTVTLGEAENQELQVTNTGNAPASFRVVDRDRGFEIATADGGRLTPGSSTRGAPLRRIETPVSPLRPDGASGSVLSGMAPGSEAWVPIADHPTKVMDNVAGSYQGRLYSFSGTADGVYGTRASYVYDPQTLQWNEIAPMPQARLKPAGAFYDGKFYVTGGWGGEPGTMVNTTSIYDPETDSWAEGAENPLPRAAAGTAVLDGTMYAVGGCAAECGSVAVVTYDIDTDTFSRVADYPEPTAWLSCGALEDKIYCAGGVGSGTQSKHAFVYDPDRDEWRMIASLPRTVWGAGYTAANGKLLVSGGVVDSAVSNAGWAYDPASDTWSALPNSTQLTYRGASACGFARVGGTAGQFNPVATAETLPGFDGCGDDSTEAAWLSNDTGSVTLAPGESTTVSIGMDSGSLTQPGIYRGALHLVEDTPFEVENVPVTLEVAAPGTWGRVGGTIAGTTCGGTTGPLSGATVGINGSSSTWTLSSREDGSYARWVDRGENPLDVVAHADGWVPDSTRVRLGKRPVTADLTLDRLSC